MLERMNLWGGDEATTIPVSALMELAQGTAVAQQLRSAVASAQESVKN